MLDQGSWSLGLGTWGKLQVRLHLFFLLFAAFTLYLGWLQPDGELIRTTAGGLVILLVSVVVHELGHFVANQWLGGSGETVVLGPLGGLAPLQPPRDPLNELLVHVMGPVVNLAVCVACIPALLVWAPDAPIWGLLNPILPQVVTDGSPPGVIALRLTFWVNWLLFTINLLPAFPFDGGRMLRAALVLCWPEHGRHRAAVTVARLARVLAAILLVVAVCLWFRRPTVGDGWVPLESWPSSWFAVLVLAMLLLFCAKQESKSANSANSAESTPATPADPRPLDLTEPPMDFSEDGFPMSDDPFSPADPWLDQEQAAMREELEAEEERLVDEILTRLHEQGMESLSPEDRSLLHRVSLRYRNRM